MRAEIDRTEFCLYVGLVGKEFQPVVLKSRIGKIRSVLKNDVLTEDVLKAFLGTLGKRIKQLRKEKKLLMRDIMVKTGYYDAQWRKYEAGGNLNIPSLMKVALALDVTLVELLDDLGHWPKVSVIEAQRRHGIVPTVAEVTDLKRKPERQVISRQRPQDMSASGKPASAKFTANTPATAETTSASPIRSKRKPSQ